MNIDQYKTDNPFNDEKENECINCGEPSDKDICSKECNKEFLS